MEFDRETRIRQQPTTIEIIRIFSEEYNGQGILMGGGGSCPSMNPLGYDLDMGGLELNVHGQVGNWEENFSSRYNSWSSEGPKGSQ